MIIARDMITTGINDGMYKPIRPPTTENKKGQIKVKETITVETFLTNTKTPTITLTCE